MKNTSLIFYQDDYKRYEDCIRNLALHNAYFPDPAASAATAAATAAPATNHLPLYTNVLSTRAAARTAMKRMSECAEKQSKKYKLYS
jgi:hypothetical protein